MAPGKKSSIVILLQPDARELLESYTRSTTIAAGLCKRTKIILLLTDRMPIAQISNKLGIMRDKIAKWGKRFLEKGGEGLSDKPGRGRKPVFSPLRCLSHC
jgi:hypothetical protein